MWLITVTNQGYPVQAVLEREFESAQRTLRRLCAEWGAKNRIKLQVMESLPYVPISMSFASSAKINEVEAWVDRVSAPRYMVSVQTVTNAGDGKNWQFCPDCGCSWLNHLVAQSDLEPDDWTPCSCTECGCKKAIKNE